MSLWSKDLITRTMLKSFTVVLFLLIVLVASPAEAILAKTSFLLPQMFLPDNLLLKFR
jgi:hypothetical protein